MLRLAFASLLLLAAFPARAAIHLPPYRLDQPAAGVKKSYYTQRILKFLDRWPPPTAALKETGPVIVRAIRTPEDPDYVGMVKHSELPVPIAKVEELTERFEDYPRIWKDVESVKVVSRDRNRVVTDWVRKSPAFFLPKVEYRVLYTIDKSDPDRVVYRQQLIQGNMVKFSDSLVVVEKLGPSRTRVSVVNFFDPDAGAFRSFAEGKIWKDCLKNAFKDDIAFRARLEHSDWSVDRIADEADEWLNRFPIDRVVYTSLLKF